MSWIWLILAGLLEVGFTTCLTLSQQFSRWQWVIGFLVCAVLSFFFLSLAIREIPMGTAYAVWTGIGAAGAVLTGIFYFQESADWKRLFCLALLILSIVGLKFVSAK